MQGAESSPCCSGLQIWVSRPSFITKHYEQWAQHRPPTCETVIIEARIETSKTSIYEGCLFTMASQFIILQSQLHNIDACSSSLPNPRAFYVILPTPRSRQRSRQTSLPTVHDFINFWAHHTKAQLSYNISVYHDVEAGTPEPCWGYGDKKAHTQYHNALSTLSSFRSHTYRWSRDNR